MDGSWELFWQTGHPVFYLLYRREEDAALQAKPAWGGNRAAEV